MAPLRQSQKEKGLQEDFLNVPECESLPVIDVSAALAYEKAQDIPPSTASQFGRAIAEACQSYGFFLVKGHGIAPELMRATLLHVARFFDLPLHVKEPLKRGYNRGYFAIGEENLNPQLQLKQGDFKEGMDLGPDEPSPVPLSEQAQLFRGPNPWPAEDLLPGFREGILEYYAATAKVARRLLALVAVAMGQQLDFFEPRLRAPLAQLRLLRYPPPPKACNGGVVEGSLGCGAHSDYGAITVLLPDAPGLQIFVPNRSMKDLGHAAANRESRKYGPSQGQWMSVPFVSGTLIVNIGDMIARMTNRAFHSTLHRVVFAPPQDAQPRPRYSMPLFYDFDYDTTVETLPEFLPDGVRATEDVVHFPDAIKLGDHLAEMYSGTYGVTVFPQRDM